MSLPCFASKCNRYSIAHFRNTNIWGEIWIIMDGILLSTIFVSLDHASTFTEQKSSNSYWGGRKHFERGVVDRKFLPKMGRKGANGRKLGGRRNLGENVKLNEINWSCAIDISAKNTIGC